ncbi:unnamed protein product [Parascedosporium putredinis]|uniref:WD40 repeat-like protein n=1 Tax=Parascedosporium putredinis TaxID=1442378 RepID=A0A9P1M7Z2_9PEZI|nr:unnamed protein product [Parascedosporium putredinis]CAI7989195.1 unnamed protein product [Parascedosporium putredinis]
MGELEPDQGHFNLSEDDALQTFLPKSFGSTSRAPDIAAQIERCRRAVAPPGARDGQQGPAAKKAATSASNDSDSDSDSDSESDDDDDEYPISHELVLKTHERAVTTVSLDPSGGSHDPDNPARLSERDMYLRDMHNTKGHISEITTGTWHPSDRNVCLTAGTDSTLRIWDVNNKRKQKEVIVFKSKAPGAGGRTRMTAVAWSSQAQGGNNIIVAAALDGTLVMYSGNGPFTRPAAEIREAHRPNAWTGGLDISSDGRMVVTRGGDDTVKLWDTRKFKEPLVTVVHPSSSDHYPMSSIKYSPADARFPLITVNWHPKINQIVTGSANSEIHVLFHPARSSRGAVETMSRAPKKRHVDDNPEFTMDQTAGMSADSIITPGGILPGSRRAGITGTGKSKDPRRPHIPQQTPFMKNAPDEKHITENIPLARMLHEDPVKRY